MISFLPQRSLMTRLCPSFRWMVSRKDLGGSLMFSDTLGTSLPISHWTHTYTKTILVFILLPLVVNLITSRLSEQVYLRFSTESKTILFFNSPLYLNRFFLKIKTFLFRWIPRPMGKKLYVSICFYISFPNSVIS